MENNNLEELLVLYALGELEPDEALAVEEELQKRPELAAEVEKVRRADGLLSDVFAQSDKAAQQELAKESNKPKLADKSETSHRLARRFAFTAAALSLFFVLGALLYPQFVSNDVQVAMTTQETTENKSVSLDTVTEGVKMEEPAPEAEEIPVLEEAQEGPLKFALNAMNDADVAAEDVAEEADEAIPPAAAAFDADMAEDDMEILPAAPAYAPLNAAAPAPAAVPVLGDANIPESKVFGNAADLPEPEEAHAQYFMRNALYDIPSQKTADGMAPIKGEIPPMKQELLPEESLGEMAVDQMNKRLETQRGANARKKAAFKLNRQDAAADVAPALDSYAMLRKSVMEESKLPNPESVNVEQWLKYFGVAEPVKAKEQERQNEEIANKDAQFIKAVNQFAAALSSPEPVDVKAFEEVLDLLKDSVGDDLKRQEFKAIVEKTIEIKKKISE
ncbi:MAG: hypothetical protein IKX40_10685 [Thermoguttaceae bacterium]|nr:hypothetical protein [Thermoguttaceae bacterium]